MSLSALAIDSRSAPSTVHADFHESATRSRRSFSPAPDASRTLRQPSSVRCFSTEEVIAPPDLLIQINPLEPSPLAASTVLSMRCLDHEPPPGTGSPFTTP